MLFHINVLVGGKELTGKKISLCAYRFHSHRRDAS